jgi:hypothetical protein
MTRGLAAAFALEAVLLAIIGLIVLDMRAHARVENLGGVNIWGYRGPIVNRKGPIEVRIAIAGGDQAFGWGVAPTETLAPFVRQGVGLDLEISGSAGRVVTAVSAGAMGLPAAEYAEWLAHLAFLHPDVVCLVLDPPDHTPSASAFLPDRSSLAFRRFGYSPILPLVLQEKGTLIASPVVRASGRALAWIDALLAGRTRSTPPSPTRPEYLMAVESAVRGGLQIAPAGVVVVVPVSVGDQPDYSWIASELTARLDRERRVRVVDPGTDDELRDAGLRLDGFHFSSAGHTRVARHVAPAVLQLVHTVAAVPQ